MILTGPEIAAQFKLGAIEITPYDEARLQPNSCDVHLGEKIGWYTSEVLDCARPNPFETHSIPPEGMLLEPDRIYLASTREKIGSTEYVPILHARSSTGRLGLFVHCTADLIDIGSYGQLTLQLHAVQQTRIYPGLLIGQVTFWATQGDIVLYSGKYQGSEGPQPSLVHRDFETR
ncbi:dCTP deaminase [Streptomyces chartreusis]|uniref:2'-deoxycytidine 5'-triphosphate deaminase n=1 Tax=Streptomyces chartreusis TaxID=1969 RepID=A0A7H8TLF4_STRCX|nr:2'-deoxycytidine 5'-triphosphate deaminase [Streptomyces chartreusis]QKZ23898.1 2'-deoxycytidine 5'-triphosphate deaminase [Streptomyces chartreusis]